MNESLPPPLPSAPPQHNPGDQPGVPPAIPGADSTYNLMADKIGGVPNVRWKDNLFQGITVLVFSIIGAVIGRYANEGVEGMLIGLLGGLIVGGLISGTVLMVIGLRRKS